MNAPLIRFMGDRSHPLIVALLNLPEEKTHGLIEVMLFDGYPVNIMDVRKPHNPYLKAVKDIGQFLEEHGFEEAGDFLGRNHAVFVEKSCDL